MKLLFTIAGLLCVAAHGQTASPRLSFEVATVKPSDAASGSISIYRTGARLAVSGFSPRQLIVWAYDLRDDHLVGDSKALDSGRYDIVAKAPEIPQPGDVQQMMQSLLADRFGLVVHHEPKELSYYALLLDRNGLKVKMAPEDADPSKNDFKMTAPGHITGTRYSADMLAKLLSAFLRRSVQDETALKGIFDFTLAWAPDNAPPSETQTLPSIFTAVQEQLGFRLESRKGPVDVLVVDRIAASPSEN